MKIKHYIRYMRYRHRYRLARIYRWAAVYGMVALLFFLLYQIPQSGIFARTFEGRSISLFDIAISWSERDPRGLMRSAVPVMAWVGNQEDYPEEISPRSIVTAILAPFRVNLSSPDDLLAGEMPALAEFRKEYRVAVSAGGGSSAGSGLSAPFEGNPADALVGIYYTHTGETYAVSDGLDRLQGQKGGVVEAGLAIKGRLETGYGIKVAHYDRVNDHNYGLSYVESEKTARILLEENKNIHILLDIHRDAGKSRSESLVKLNGEDLAPILFVVGSDARSPFPTWRNNYDFAVKIAERINKKYPGLCIGVRIKEGRYNQFLHPRALLVEIGSVNNTRAEAVKTAGMLAEVLAEEIMETAPELLMRPNDKVPPPNSTGV